MNNVTIVNALLQFIKAAGVSSAFKKHGPDVLELLVHKGQHYDVKMSDISFCDLYIPNQDYIFGVDTKQFCNNGFLKCQR